MCLPRCSCRERRSVAGTVEQAAVLSEVPDRVLRVPERFVEAREVVVTVRERRIFLDRRLVRLECGARLAEVLQEHSAVEHQQSVGPALIQRAPIDVVSFPDLASFMQESTPVDPGCDVVWVDPDSVRVGTARRILVVTLKLERLGEPLLGTLRARLARRCRVVRYPRSLDHVQYAVLENHVEAQQVLSVVRLPAGRAIP